MTTSRTRSGFTLVELVMVIAVIGVLVALIGPALYGAMRRAKEAAQRVEITQLESAVVSFKAKFGVEPPSGVTLYERPGDWVNDAPSSSAIRRVWPQFNFGLARDINRNGTTTDRIVLDGAECLVFFLSGTIDNTKSPSGFATNPTDPFLSVMSAPNRIGPFYEFDVSRFDDVDADGMREYRGYLAGAGTDPIVYYSGYEGRGYVANDEYVSPLVGRAAAAYSLPGTVAQAAPTPFKAQTFQIIAPGWDGYLGDGGLYDPSDPVASLAMNRPTTVTAPDYKGIAEYDNLVNFVAGPLKP